jgi:hypothetical protein
LASDQIRSQRRQAIDLALRPGVLDCHVPPLNIAGLAQALAERNDQMAIGGRRPAAEESNNRGRRLLRAQSDRPSDRQSTCKAKKFASPHETL